MKRIIYVHGRDYKPQKEVLLNNYNTSVALGLQRDWTQEHLELFEKIDIEMAYYGEVSNEFLDKHWDAYDEAKDIIDRTQSIKDLSKYSKAEFVKEQYKKLAFNNSIFETIADITSKPMSLLGLGDKIIGLFAPDIRHYWNKDSSFGSKVREPLTKMLHDALKSDDEVLLISHSLGTMIAYDVLWKFSYYSEYKDIRDKKLHTLLTLGSPLGDENVKSKLKGSGAKGRRKYPQNISSWINVAAHDDFIAHDENIQDDFKDINIVDIRNYNLALRYKKSDPHHAVGYLISPEVIKIIANFLK